MANVKQLAKQSAAAERRRLKEFVQQELESRIIKRKNSESLSLEFPTGLHKSLAMRARSLHRPRAAVIREIIDIFLPLLEISVDRLKHDSANQPRREREQGTSELNQQQMAQVLTWSIQLEARSQKRPPRSKRCPPGSAKSPEKPQRVNLKVTERAWILLGVAADYHLTQRGPLVVTLVKLAIAKQRKQHSAHDPPG